MDALAIEKAHLLGNSFGCQVLAEFALRYPQRVERLVFVAPTVDPAYRTYWQQGWRFAWNALGVPPSLVWVVLVDYARAGLPRALATIKMVMNDRIEERLPSILAPTLVVRGEHDKLVPQRWVEEVVKLLPNGRLAVIRDTGHVPNYATPAEVARVIRPFLGL
jgi:pimeloyl-ACP methyl ester carboxylesterase